MGRSVGELGEFGLVAEVTARLPQGRGVAVGPGDDAAVVDAPDARVVVTVDVLVEGRHFRRDWSSAEDIGHRAAAASLADVVAMGARPTAVVVGLALPPDLDVDWPLGLADGLREECALVGASVVGGDVVRSDVVTVSVTALGDLEGRPPVTRSGARGGDVVAVVGRLGWAAAGHAVLSRGFRSPRVLVDAHRRPEPPYQQGPAAAAFGATAMADVSDGLLADIGHVALASGVDVDLVRVAFELPDPLVEVGAALNVDPVAWVLTGGDDHALVAAFPGDATLPTGWRVVGRAVAGTGAVTVDGRAWDGTGGWEHFG